MKYQLCAVYDKKATAFMAPFTAGTFGLAERMFTDAVNNSDSNNTMHTHPEDYSLFHIGEYDDQSGQIISIQPKLLLEALTITN